MRALEKSSRDQQAIRPTRFALLFGGATDHLEAFPVAEVVADCGLVIGTSRRLRDVDAPPEWPAAGVDERLDSSVKTAILFGCERTGLLAMSSFCALRQLPFQRLSISVYEFSACSRLFEL